MVNLLKKLGNINIRLKFIIASIIPTIILISMTIKPIITTYRGTEVNVLVNAFYSSDSVRGKNLYLNYKFENAPYDKLPESIKNIDINSSYKRIDGYAVLKQVDGIYDLDYVTMEKPQNKIYLKCSIHPEYYKENPNESKEISAYINCNLDRYFVSDEESLLLEMDKYNYASNQWLYVAKIKIYNGYGILEDVKLKN